MNFKVIVPTNLKIETDKPLTFTYNKLIFKCVEITVKFSSRFDNIKVNTGFHDSVQFNGKDNMRASFENFSLSFDTNNTSQNLRIILQCNFDELDDFNEVYNKLIDVVNCLGLKSE